MRRWLFSLALGALLLATPLWGQRGGGGHGGMSGGGGHGSSGGGGYAAHGGGGYAYRGAGTPTGASSYHGSVGYGRVPTYAGAARPGAYWNGGARTWNGTGWHGNTNWNTWHGNNWNNWHGNGWGWRGGCWWCGRWGYGWGYPWWGFGWGGGGWGGYPGGGWYGGAGWDDSYYSYPAYSDTYSSQTYPSYVTAAPAASDYSQQTQTQQDEINQLNAEVDTLRSQQQSPPPAARPQGKMTEIRGETVLIYRDGHAEEVENYAIVGKTLWIFNEARARKIPLADLDLPATKRDNEDRGINFVVPSSSR